MRARPVVFVAVLAGMAAGLAGTARADRDDWGRGWGGPSVSFGLSVPAYAPPPVYYAPPPPAYYPPPPPAYYPPPAAYYPPPRAYYAPPPPVVVAPPTISFGVAIPVR
ncbi:MAG TPA: hypothetical protein VNE67_13435 [Acetobacteraceae bacterium]|nr:hypothetical protein [Acetobacteraceae bacterium]